MTTHRDNRRGDALIETIVGLSIVLMAMTGIIALVTRAFALNTDTSSKFVAAELAGEGLELMKYYLVSDWNKVTPGVYEVTYTCDIFGTMCAPNIGADLSRRSQRTLNIDANGMYSYNPGTPTTYTRSVVVDWSGTSAEVASIVSWTLKGQKNEIQLSDKLFRWHQ